MRLTQHHGNQSLQSRHEVSEGVKSFAEEDVGSHGKGTECHDENYHEAHYGFGHEH